RGAVPVMLSGFEEDAVARQYLLDRAAAALDPPSALGDVDGLAVRVRMPRGACTRSEPHGAGVHSRPIRGARDGIDIDVPGKPLRGTFPGGRGVPRDLHSAPPAAEL